jgi:hypothetical protein
MRVRVLICEAGSGNESVQVTLAGKTPLSEVAAPEQFDDSLYAIESRHSKSIPKSGVAVRASLPGRVWVWDGFFTIPS